MHTTTRPVPVPVTHNPRRWAIATLLTACATLLANLAQYAVPKTQTAFELAHWLAPSAAVAAIAGTAAVLAGSRQRTVIGLNGVAVALMACSATGVIFDGLALVYWLFGGPMPYWPHSLSRIFALVTGILLFVTTVRYRRLGRGECLRCGREPDSPPVRQRLWLGYAGVVLSLPYIVLKTNWAMGGTIGLDFANTAMHGFSRGWLTVPIALVGVVLSLTLVHQWGRIWPSWVPMLAGRPTPRKLILTGAWFGTGLLLTMGFAGVVYLVTLLNGQDVTNLGGMHGWVPTLFYCSWLLWGLVFAPSTWLYHLRTQPRCVTCESQSA